MLTSLAVGLPPLETRGLFPPTVMDCSISRSLILFSHRLAGLQQPALPADQDAELSSGEPETV